MNIAVTKNHSNHKGAHQLNTKLFFVRDELEKSIRLQFCSSSKNLADIYEVSSCSKTASYMYKARPHIAET